MIQFILAALIALAPSPDKAPIIYQEIVTPYVQEKTTRYIDEVHKAGVGVEYLSGKARMTDYIKSPEAENTYLFYIQIILETIYLKDDYEYKGLQGMNMMIIVTKDEVIYSMITRPYWIHKEERRLIKWDLGYLERGNSLIA